MVWGFCVPFVNQPSPKAGLDGKRLCKKGRFVRIQRPEFIYSENNCYRLSVICLVLAWIFLAMSKKMTLSARTILTLITVCSSVVALGFFVQMILK
ncbi:hypothetical protein SAMN05444064_12158 [Pseudomonas syringae]|nr:hypothetical protein SAMN05444514_12158 [Pseudomonas syringae]SFM57812.1 hypothetical protein SAMN05444064_12158 [Pseudomonas syringae]